MRLEDDPTVKSLPSERMKKQMHLHIIKANQKLVSKANQGA